MDSLDAMGSKGLRKGDGPWSELSAAFARFCEHAIEPGDDVETRHLKAVFACYELLGLPFMIMATLGFYQKGLYWAFASNSAAFVVNAVYVLYTVGVIIALYLKAPIRPLYYVSCAVLMLNMSVVQVALGGSASSGYASLWAVLSPVALLVNDLPGAGIYLAVFVVMEAVFYAMEPVIRTHIAALDPSLSRYFLFFNAVGVVIFLYVPILHLKRLRFKLTQELQATSKALAEVNMRRIEDAERVAKTDHLTGLPNRNCFERDWIPKIESKGACAFVALDLDHFKLVNDLHGHDAGDRALAKTTEIGSEVFQDGEGNLFRFGGEEFIAVLFCDPEEALRRAEDFRARLESRAARELAAAGLLLKRPVPDGSLVERTLTASLGIAIWPRDTPDLRAAMKLADEASYRAKQAGRNRVVCAA
jgi:diguanylate cyclase (GGDEF)-like protein